MTARTTGPRRTDTYRGYLRNKQFGRKPKGNTKPYERRLDAETQADGRKVMSFDLDRLYAILGETTVQLRKGAAIEGTPELVAAISDPERDPEKPMPGGVVEIFAMPHESEAADTLDRVDMGLLTIGVNRASAEEHRAEFTALMRAYPKPDRLAGGPSYIEVGAEIGDQGAAFQLFALGKTLGLWDVITPASLGASGEEAKHLAGRGFVMITGLRP